MLLSSEADIIFTNKNMKPNTKGSEETKETTHPIQSQDCTIPVQYIRAGAIGHGIFEEM